MNGSFLLGFEVSINYMCRNEDDVRLFVSLSTFW